MTINRPLLYTTINEKLETPKLTSPLKKKLNLLSKLKNIVNTPHENILVEFKNEDMSNFLAEISNILLTQMRNEDDCHVTINASVFFMRLYATFKNIYIQNLKNLIQNTVKSGSVYLLLLIYFEYTFLINEESIEKVFKVLKVSNNEMDSARFCMYASSVYKEMTTEYEEMQNNNSYDSDILAQKNSFYTNPHFTNIKKFIVEFVNEKKEIFDKNLVDITKIYENINENYVKETKDFVKIIEPEENEFDFYSSIDLAVNGECYNEYERFIKQTNTCEIEKLTEISIRKIRKCKGMQQICKIMLNNKNLTERIASMIENTNENSNEECYMLFLCELSKFDRYSKTKIIKKGEMFIKDNNVKMLVLMLDNIARFYLNDVSTNLEMRCLLQKIKTYKNQCTEIMRIEINSCLSRIIKRKRNENVMNDFLCYTIKKGFDPCCDFGKLISKEMAIIFFMKPWIFEDVYFVVEMIVHYKIEEEIKKMYNDAIFICLLEGIKDKVYSYVRVYANLVKYNDEECKIFVKRILKLKKSVIKVLIVFLKEIENKKEFVKELETIVEMQGSSEEIIEYKNFMKINNKI